MRPCFANHGHAARLGSAEHRPHRDSPESLREAARQLFIPTRHGPTSSKRPATPGSRKPAGTNQGFRADEPKMPNPSTNKKFTLTDRIRPTRLYRGNFAPRHRYPVMIFRQHEETWRPQLLENATVICSLWKAYWIRIQASRSGEWLAGVGFAAPLHTSGHASVPDC